MLDQMQKFVKKQNEIPKFSSKWSQKIDGKNGRKTWSVCKLYQHINSFMMIFQNGKPKSQSNLFETHANYKYAYKVGSFEFLLSI